MNASTHRLAVLTNSMLQAIPKPALLKRALPKSAPMQLVPMSPLMMPALPTLPHLPNQLKPLTRLSLPLRPAMPVNHSLRRWSVPARSGSCLQQRGQGQVHGSGYARRLPGGRSLHSGRH